MKTEGFTKQFYKIKDVSEILGVPQSTLRFWETEFPEICPKRSIHNQRKYTPKDIENIRIIHFLVKIKGMKIEAAKEYLKDNKKNVTQKIKIVDKLTHVRNELSNLMDALEKRMSRMETEAKDNNSDL